MGLTLEKEIPPRHFSKFCGRLPSMAGKSVAVTGCTTGTGLICAKQCAQLGADVIMLNRPSERAEKALREVQSVCPQGSPNKASLVHCDLGSFSSVRNAAAQVQAMLQSHGLDVLCNNAGVMMMPDEATVDGFDVQMQTNHLSHFLLTAELLPLLELAARQRGEARVVNHSSIARLGKHLQAKYLRANGGDLGGSSGDWKRYQQSKLANVVFTYALDDELRRVGSKVKSIVCHPGVAVTNLQTSTPNQSVGMKAMYTYMAQSAEDGTMPILLACCAPEVASGDFFGPKNWQETSGKVQLLQPEPLADVASREMLWSESIAATSVAPRPSQIAHDIPIGK